MPGPCRVGLGALGLLLASTAWAAFPKTFTLSDGTDVIVEESGALRLLADGRTIFATAPGADPIIRRFDDGTNGIVGQWAFPRENEQTVTLDRRRGVGYRRRVDTVRVKWKSSATFADERRRARGLLTVTTLVPGEASLVELSIRRRRREAPLSSIAVPLRCDPDATFFGFGEQYDGTDHRGEAFPLFVSEQGIRRLPDLPPQPLNGTPHTTYFPMPYWLDARGFGGLVLSDRRVEVDLCARDADVAWIEQVDPAPMRIVVFHGPTPLDVIRQLGDQVGRPDTPPAWAWDLWIGSQGGDAAVRAEAAALRTADVPAGVLWVQDWSGVRINFDGGKGVEYRWAADPTHYPNLAGLITDLHADGYRFLAYANPFVDEDLEFFAPMDTAGFLIHDAAGATYSFFSPAGLASTPDVTNPAARSFVKDALRSMVTDYGIDGWMSDFGEWTPTDAVYADGSDPVAMHNRYPVEWHRLWREVMDEERPGDYAVFARSGWTGVQAVSQIHWAGDQQTDWSTTDGLPTVVPALLNLGISGIPYVTHDIAGFSGTLTVPSTKELFQRWTELGAFTPIMRTHEGAERDDNWSWEIDTETTDHFRRFSRIHAALRPEWDALAAEAAATSAPILRHLMLEYPGDPASRKVSDQFLIGASLLVAPVVTEGATTRDVYLPPGATWYHVWTGMPYAGGQTITIDAPIGSPPIFSKDADRADLRLVS